MITMVMDQNPFHTSPAFILSLASKYRFIQKNFHTKYILCTKHVVFFTLSSLTVEYQPLPKEDLPVMIENRRILAKWLKLYVVLCAKVKDYLLVSPSAQCDNVS